MVDSNDDMPSGGSDGGMEGVGGEIGDRGAEVLFAGKTFPAPKDFDGATPDSDRSLYGRAPWFDREVIMSEEELALMMRYASDGMLPGSIPVEALRKFAWRSQFSAADADLRVRGENGLEAARAVFVHECYVGLKRLLSTEPIDAAWGLDLWTHRTGGEIPYVQNLCSITGVEIEKRRGQSGVDIGAVCYAKPLLCVDFRYVRKSRVPYWNNDVKYEHRCAYALGRIVPRQCAGAFSMTETARDRAWMRLSDNPVFHQLRAPRGMRVEVEPVLSYCMSVFLADPSTGLWVTACTERVISNVAAMLFEVYDTYRLWYVGARTREYANHLGMSMEPYLGTKREVREVLELIDIIEDTDWTIVDPRWAEEGAGNPAHYSLSAEGLADYTYYYPWGRRKLSESEVLALARSPPRVRPSDHPTGWNWADAPEVDVMLPPRDSSRDYVPSTSVVAGDSGSTDPRDHVARFLVECGVMSRSDAAMTSWEEMRAFVRGRLTRE